MIDQLNKLTDEEVSRRVALACPGIFRVAKESGDIIWNRDGYEQDCDLCKDLNAAFTLVEKLRGEGWRFMLDNIADNWEAEFFRRTPRASRIKIGANPARAICLSFLAVAEREEG